MPPSVEKRGEQTDVAPAQQPPAPPAPSAERRTAWRRGFMHGIRYMRQSSPQTPQSQMGWVITRIGHALGDNPYMAEQDIEALVDSLVGNAPVYETGEAV